MSHSHAIAWMDSREARIFKFNRQDVEKRSVKAHLPFRKIHHKAGVIGSGHIHLDHAYFDDIAAELTGVQEWLLMGPSTAKEELCAYLKSRLPGLDKALFAVEAADHPTDGQLLDHARRFFKAADRMKANSPDQLER